MPRKEKKRVADRKYHYTYLITDKVNNKFYYGVHSTDFDPNDIEQYHSSSKHLKLLVRGLGIGNFSKQVRRYFKSRQEADAWEHKVLRRMKVRTRKDFYNQSEGGIGFVSSGYLSVKCLKTGKNLRVPCDDPYIGVLYEYVGKGRRLSEKERANLSEIYKGKWSGDSNPVHKLKDDPEWRKKVSSASVGKTLSQSQIESLKDPSHWNHLLSYKPSENVQQRMDFMQSINNIKFRHIYIYEGVIYLHLSEVPCDRKTKTLTIIEKPHPKVDTIFAGGEYFIDIKHAAAALGVHKNTVTNRIKSDNPAWEDYYFLEYDTILESKKESERRFLEELYKEFKDTIQEQINYKKPVSIGMSDEELTTLFMSTGSFLDGSTFKRLPEKNANGTYSWLEVTCPLCSKDEYVEMGLCSGRFIACYGSLVKGAPPCRCGSLKSLPVDIYIYHIKKVCETEGLVYDKVGG